MKYRYNDGENSYEGYTEDKIVIENCLYDNRIGKFIDVNNPNKAVQASDRKVLSYLIGKHMDWIVHGNVSEFITEIVKERHFRSSDVRSVFKHLIALLSESDYGNKFISNLKNVPQEIQDDLKEIDDLEKLVLYCMRLNANKINGKIDLSDSKSYFPIYKDAIIYSVYKGFNVTSLDIVLMVEDILEKEYKKVRNGVYAPNIITDIKK